MKEEEKAFYAGVCIALACAQRSPEVWKQIVYTVGESKILNYAAFVEPREWSLAGFQELSVRELGMEKPKFIRYSGR